MVVAAGFEPPNIGSRVNCSTIELQPLAYIIGWLKFSNRYLSIHLDCKQLAYNGYFSAISMTKAVTRESSKQLVIVE